MESNSLHFFRLLPQCTQDLHSFGIVCSVELQFCTDVSGQPVDLIFNVKAVQEEDLKIGLIGCPETSLQNYHSVLLKSQKSTDLTK